MRPGIASPKNENCRYGAGRLAGEAFGAAVSSDGWFGHSPLMVESLDWGVKRRTCAGHWAGREIDSRPQFRCSLLAIIWQDTDKTQPQIFIMSSLTVALISAGCIFSGVLLGMWLRDLLPGHHLSSDSKDTVKLAAGMIATLSALVLGLLVSSAKSSFDTVGSEITQSATKIILLDRTLASYGPATKDAREQLRHSVIAGIETIWPEVKTTVPGMITFERANAMEQLQMKLRELTPVGEAQRQLLAQAQQLSGELLQFRWLVIEQTQNALPMPFLVMLLFWLTMLHMSFGLFAPRNATVVVVLLLCALSVSGAVFLILEMNHPLSGFIKVSSAPMLKALEHLGQ